LVFSVISALTLWGVAFWLAMVGVTSLGANNEALPMFLTAAGITFIGLLLLPSAGYALLRILNRPAPFKFKLHRPGWVIFFLPMVVVLGYFIAQSPNLAWIVLPPLHIIAIGVSVFWLLYLGLRGLPIGSPQRVWGIFGSGLVLGPALSLVAELLVLFLVVFFWGMYLIRDPVVFNELVQLSEQLLASPDMPPDAILDILEPYLFKPSTIYLILFFGAVLVPLIEEMFKPIGVWLLAGRNLTAVQGFTAGLISGAGYALFESFTLGASSVEEWSFVVSARLGTSMIHILTAGLMGWALARAWRERQYIRFGLTYLVSVSIHALWNGLVILSIVPEVMPTNTAVPEAFLNIGMAAPVGFIFLLMGGFILLLGCNFAMRRAIIPPVNSPSEPVISAI
jgi:hypothetical protein